MIPESGDGEGDDPKSSDTTPVPLIGRKRRGHVRAQLPGQRTISSIEVSVPSTAASATPATPPPPADPPAPARPALALPIPSLPALSLAE